ncbi:MAG: hypothetical protein QNJ13_06035 [Paracoccaceae bacterium]|nr:hypothetical protein [Paracoccaceae bacterium]
MNIKDYFNRSSFGKSGPGWNATMGAALSVFMLSTGSLPFAAFGLVMAGYTAGQVNRWQNAAKGQPIWKPRFEALGL